MSDQTTTYFMREISHWKNRALKAERPYRCEKCEIEMVRNNMAASSQVRKYAVENHKFKREIERLTEQVQQLEAGALFEQLSQAEARIFQLESVIDEQQSVVDQLMQEVQP